jgi:D-alanine-D-alanine ligase
MKKNIAIFSGGNSGEYEISIKSGEVVSRHLDKDLFEPYLIIVKNDEWTYKDNEGLTYQVDRDNMALDLPGGKVIFDIIFNAIHGTPGEDGRLQVLFDEAGIPCTSCDFVTSALTFNKYLCNCYLSSLDVLTAESLLLRHGDEVRPEDIVNSIGLPCFVKPNKGGSSVGISKVTELDAILEAVRKAWMEDDEVIIEKFIPGREITCGVMTRNSEVLALPLTEIISENEFFDYEAKYLGRSAEITPAQIPEEIERNCKHLSTSLYRDLDCKGVVRFDYIYNESGMFFLEVNTIPGLTEESIVPQQAREAGISLKEFFTDLLEQSSGNQQAWQ